MAVAMERQSVAAQREPHFALNSRSETGAPPPLCHHDALHKKENEIFFFFFLSFFLTPDLSTFSAEEKKLFLRGDFGFVELLDRIKSDTNKEKNLDLCSTKKNNKSKTNTMKKRIHLCFVCRAVIRSSCGVDRVDKTILQTLFDVDGSFGHQRRKTVNRAPKKDFEIEFDIGCRIVGFLHHQTHIVGVGQKRGISHRTRSNHHQILFAISHVHHKLETKPRKTKRWKSRNNLFLFFKQTKTQPNETYLSKRPILKPGDRNRIFRREQIQQTLR
jgi:hypothetical protein